MHCTDGDIQQNNKKKRFNNPHSEPKDTQSAVLLTRMVPGDLFSPDMIVSMIEWWDSGGLIHACFELSAIIRDGNLGDLFITDENTQCWQEWCTAARVEGY